MIVLAIDPSLSSTGYAVIDSDKKLICKGKINVSQKETTDERVFQIINKLNYLPKADYIIFEDGFVGKNVQGSLKLAELRGAIIFNFKSQQIPVIHQQPKEIRKNFGLSGNAKKEEVANKVQEYYPFLQEQIGPYSDKQNKDKTSDIYDAISIGLSFVINQKE